MFQKEHKNIKKNFFLKSIDVCVSHLERIEAIYKRS